MKKYRLTKNKKEVCGKVFFQILALCDGEYFRKNDASKEIQDNRRT